MCFILISFSSYVDASENNKTGPSTCEDLAVDVYWHTLEIENGTWQEANENFTNAYMSCCFSYPNDCGDLVILP